MVVEIKSISCVESLKKIPEIFGLEKGNFISKAFCNNKKSATINDVLNGIDCDLKMNKLLCDSLQITIG